MGWYFFDRWVVLACLVACILVSIFVIQLPVAAEEFSRRARLGSPYRFIAINDNTLIIQVYYVTAIIPFMCLTLLLTLVSCFYVWTRFMQWRSRSSSISDAGGASTSREEEEQSDSNRPSSKFLHEFVSYREEELKKAANGFCKQIGEGSNGVVFEGTLLHEGEKRQVAIKRMKGVYHKGLNDDFKKEVRRISMLRHKNVVQLLGYSDGDSKKDVHLSMVTPLHSSLAKHLDEPDKCDWLNWAARLKIGLGVAEGLTYLHDQAPQQFVHHDIKPGNILFDYGTFQSYIADFGTARLMPHTQEPTYTDTFVGTSAYADPHFKAKGRRSAKVDVYSFGVLLYVLIAGAPRNSVPTFVENARDDNIIDPEFEGHEDDTYNQEEINRCLAIAKQCTEYDPDKRPRMYRVVMMMRGDIPVWSIAQDVSRVAASAAMFAHSSFSSLRRFSPNF
jgi:hypothetical protein